MIYNVFVYWFYKSSLYVVYVIYVCNGMSCMGYLTDTLLLCIGSITVAVTLREWEL